MAVHTDWYAGRELFGGFDAYPGFYVAGAVSLDRRSLSRPSQHWQSGDVAGFDLHLDYGRGLGCGTGAPVADQYPTLLRILFRNL